MIIIIQNFLDFLFRIYLIPEAVKPNIVDVSSDDIALKVHILEVPMKNHLLLPVVCISIFLLLLNHIAADTIWSEDFSSYTEGTGIDGTGNIGDYPSGVSKWSLDTTGSDLVDSGDYCKTVGGVLEIQDSGGDLIWLSESVDISGYSKVGLSLEAKEVGDHESTDYFDVEYKINDDDFILVTNWNSKGDESHTLISNFSGEGDGIFEVVTVSNLSGNTIQIRITMRNNAADEKIKLDNVNINNSTTVQFSSSSASVSEESGTYNLVVSITNPDEINATTADVVLISGNAADINGYTTQSINFPAGSDDDQTVVLTISDDSDIEGSEDLVFSLQSISGGDSAYAGSPSNFTLTIEDNDLPNAWINEIHYDNASSDVNEGVEVVIENPGDYTLENFTLTLYNGADSALYKSETLNNFTVGNSEANFTLYYKMISEIQNGAPDGMALDYDGTLIQFLSYEGVFTASGGAADGVTSENIGVSESGSTDSSTSLQLTGNGTQYSDFTWTTDLAQTWGSQNNDGDQSLPVELQEFNALPGNGRVILCWATASETDNLGFNLYRSISRNSDYELLNEQLIPGQGSTSQRHAYRYTDRDVRNGTTYYYQIEDVDYGGRAELHAKVVSAVPGGEEATTIAKGFRMTPCYPNPFNPETTLHFQLGEAAKVQVQVYDLLGNLVTTLTDAHYPVGEYCLHWNGCDDRGRLSSTGIYFIHISSSTGFSSTQKVVFLR